MIMETTCEMCGRTIYLQITKEQKEEYDRYSVYGNMIQDALKSFNKFEREFIKSGYCPECQSLLFHNDLSKSESKFFYADELRFDVMEKFLCVDTKGMKLADAILSPAADQLTINEKNSFFMITNFKKSSL